MLVPDEIEKRAKEASVPMVDVLARAGVAQTTWWRWTEGRFEPRFSTLRRINGALEAVISERVA